MKNKTPLVYTLIFLLTLTGTLSMFTPAQAETWTDITLPYIITQSGNYRVAEACNGSGLLLSINASNVIVDGQDKLLQSTQREDDYAISIAPGCTNILLKEFNVTGSDYGLYAIDAGNFTLKDSTFVNNTAAAVFAFNVTDFAFLHSRVSNNSNGLVVIDSSNLTITDSHFKNNTFGMQIIECRDIGVQSNYFNNNSYGLTSEGSNNTTVRDSVFIENYCGVEAMETDLTINNIDVSDNSEIGLACLGGNLTAQNFAVNNNALGLYTVLCNVTATYGSIANNSIGLYTIMCNTTAVDCAINNNTQFGVAVLGSYSTILDDCSVSNNSYGILSYAAQNMVLKNSVIANNSLGMEDYRGNNTLITGNIFDKNGLYEDPAFGGAVIFEETNCTVTNNAFTNNYDALMLGIFSEENNTQTYHYNSFVNNSYTFDFNYRLASNFTNQQIYFYNNIVNDTGYVNSASFYNEALLAPPSTVLHLNITLQAGERAYSSGRMVGGNYWAHPNGTGPSQTATDADTDGFADSAFDLFGNGTVYDYLPYTSQYIENVTSLTISPQSATIKAGQNVTFTTTAHDKYGNTWTVDPTYIVDGLEYTSNPFVGGFARAYYITVAYGNQTASATVTVTPGDLSRYVVLVPSTAKVGEEFTIRVKAWDHYGNTVTDFDGSVTLSISGSSLSPSTTGTFTEGVWTGNVTVPTAGTYTITATDSNGKTGTSIAFAVVSEETTTPTPTPSATVKATKEDGSKVNLGLGGNITNTQISDATISLNQTAQTITISLTVTGQSGNSGFCNLTIPKSSVYFGIAPTVLIDGQPAANQGFTENNQNFYVWFTTSFSTHQVAIRFTAQQSTTADNSLLWYGLIVVIVVLAIALALVVYRAKRK
ncbi:MAG TPA: right-handed parallel beta-helix repeat-containing protein [Candidatus Acidoferrales bacterium]|nr:right-handed parallel beta-helix repeat-containing protein [Candidatus Acidoferrales bacterium]